MTTTNFILSIKDSKDLKEKNVRVSYADDLLRPLHTQNGTYT